MMKHFIEQQSSGESLEDFLKQRQTPPQQRTFEIDVSLSELNGTRENLHPKEEISFSQMVVEKEAECRLIRIESNDQYDSLPISEILKPEGPKSTNRDSVCLNKHFKRRSDCSSSSSSSCPRSHLFRVPHQIISQSHRFSGRNFSSPHYRKRGFDRTVYFSLFLILWSIFLFFLVPGIWDYHVPVLFRRLFNLTSSGNFSEASQNALKWDSLLLSPAMTSSRQVGRPHGPIPLPSSTTFHDVIAQLHIDVNQLFDGLDSSALSEGRELLENSEICFFNAPASLDLHCTLAQYSWDALVFCLPSSQERHLNRELSQKVMQTAPLRIMIVRLLGNDLPPIQGSDQMRINLNHILQHENYPQKVVFDGSGDPQVVQWHFGTKQRVPEGNFSAGQEVPKDALSSDDIVPGRCQFGSSTDHSSSFVGRPSSIVVQRMAVVNRIMDVSAYNDIVRLLDGNFHQKKKSDHSNDVEIIKSDRNNEMQSAPRWLNSEAVIEVPFDLHLMKIATSTPNYVTNQNRARNWSVQEAVALGADWVMSLDGNIFVTMEGYLGSLRSFVDAGDQQFKYNFSPFYRVALSGVKPEDVVHHVSPYSTIHSLLPNLTRNEAQISFRSGADVLFEDERGYGRLNKYNLLMKLRDRAKEELRHCVEADIGFDLNSLDPALESTVTHRCGYTLRLSYWPLVMRPDFVMQNSDLRSRLRHVSTIVFSQRLADALGRSFIDEYASSQFMMLIILLFFLGVITIITYTCWCRRWRQSRGVCCSSRSSETND